jgi:uncharacterized membrane protein
MIPSSGTADRLNSRLAKLMRIGTWVACGFIAVGLTLPLLALRLASVGLDIVSIGIVVLIALPVLGVAVTGLWFLLRRDLDFAVVAALVLAIIAISAVLGASAS